ncbi:hypothetical protein [Bradyrhizobium sp. dw_78]|uniref:hypothetical protein n=1 Tax=Bradyrhizobium sp. dw_78 TaxID=2719793 RepID=UPI001BD62259|nr:hypothetical protein [Bradyrhizobium sp. dw_78]
MLENSRPVCALQVRPGRQAVHTARSSDHDHVAASTPASHALTASENRRVTHRWLFPETEKFQLHAERIGDDTARP